MAITVEFIYNSKKKVNYKLIHCMLTLFFIVFQCCISVHDDKQLLFGRKNIAERFTFPDPICETYACNPQLLNVCNIFK